MRVQQFQTDGVFDPTLGLRLFISYKKLYILTWALSIIYPNVWRLFGSGWERTSSGLVLSRLSGCGHLSPLDLRILHPTITINPSDGVTLVCNLEDHPGLIALAWRVGDTYGQENLSTEPYGVSIAPIPRSRSPLDNHLCLSHPMTELLCKAFSMELPLKTIQRLQWPRMQRYKQWWTYHDRLMYHYELHWLPFGFCMQLMVLVTDYKSLHGIAPFYGLPLYSGCLLLRSDRGGILWDLGREFSLLQYLPSETASSYRFIQLLLKWYSLKLLKNWLCSQLWS